MAELALECLVGEGVRAAVVANRTFARAELLAQRYGATAMPYEGCWPHLPEVDLLLCATAAPHAVVQREHIAPGLRARGDRPLCVLDIALPRDVDPRVGELANVFLYDLDDLRAVTASALERRRKDVPSAEEIVAAEVESYWSWLAGLSAVPVLRSFRGRMDALREEELRHLMRRLPNLPPEERALVEHFSRALMNKFLHEPSVRLRAAAGNGRGLAAVDTLRYLFDLDRTHSAEGDPPSPSTSDLDS